MSHDQASSLPEKSLERTSIKPQTAAELFHAIDLAFDYRGDVTLELKSGESVIGYVFGRRSDDADPFVELYLDGKPEQCLIRYRDIETIHFSGEDTAIGKSWEAWIKKKQTEALPQKVDHDYESSSEFSP